MTKRFVKDNRGQVIYAVIITMVFIGMLAMIAMGLTLKNYHAAQQKQQRTADYYAADAVAELIRIGEFEEIQAINAGEGNNKLLLINLETYTVISQGDAANAEAIATVTWTGDDVYTIVTDTATVVAKIADNKFHSWEVSYHAAKAQE